MPDPTRLERAQVAAQRAYLDSRYALERTASNVEGDVSTVTDPWKQAVLAAAAVILEPYPKKAKEMMPDLIGRLAAETWFTRRLAELHHDAGSES